MNFDAWGWLLALVMGLLMFALLLVKAWVMWRKPSRYWVPLDDCDCVYCQRARKGPILAPRREPEVVVEKWKFLPPTVRHVISRRSR